MTISGPTRSLVAVAAATALTLSIAPPAAHAQADGPDFGAPTVGACSTMTAKQSDAKADKSTVVPCSQGHTAKVAGVVQLPGRLDYSSKLVKLYRVMENKCRPQADAMLGRRYAVRDSSAYQVVWFIPTKNQRQHGARWISCSVVLRQAFRLAKLPTDNVPLLPSGKLGDGIHRCLLADVTTRCKARHGWRATGSFVIDSKKYPGFKAVSRKGKRRCASKVQPGKAYRYTWSAKIPWQVGGDHAVICFSKTTS
jgi:hypothetical protein